jgi:hypothetical protein
MKTLSSKLFDIAENGDLNTLCDAFYRWLLSFGDLEGKRIAVSIKTIKDRRAQKKTALRQLEETIVASVRENRDTPVVWENFGYYFCFIERKYYWHDREIHVTANEALFLYRWLVLNAGIHKTQVYYLRNMRRRLGKAFLSEVMGCM